MADRPQPMITTIIPTYRRPEMLRKAILSVQGQTYSNFQICVYDNASGDGTEAMVAELAKSDERIKYHCHEHNLGGIANFNYGLARVETPFFTLLGDDNELLPHFFEAAITKLTRHSEAAFFAGETMVVDPNGKVLRLSLDGWETGIIPPPSGLVPIWKCGFTWESVLFRSQIIEKVGYLDDSLDGSADQDFMMRLARRERFYVSKVTCAQFLSHDDSWTSRRELADLVTINKKILNRWLDDESLERTIKIQLEREWKQLIKAKISHQLYHRCILAKDDEILKKAWPLIRSELGLSPKPLYSLFIARLSNLHWLFRKIVAALSLRYVQFRRDRYRYQMKRGSN